MTPVPTERPPVEVAPPSIASAVIVTVPATRPARPRVRVSPAVLIAAAVLVGLGFRVGVYLRDASLWGDEAMLAVNVVHRTPAQLLEPLELNQGAPLGFLLASKAVVAIIGPSELALRFVPLLASVAGFLLFVPFAYRVLPLASARLAVVLAAFSPYLVGYAAEFKQYELDAAIAVALLALGRRAWDGGTRRDQVRLALAGAAAVWFSHPAVFVLGGVGAVLLARRDRGSVLVVLAWVASFAACYLLFLKNLGRNAYLTDFWAGQFLPLSAGGLPWLVHHFTLLFATPGGFGGEVNASALAAVCFVIGAVALAGTDGRLVAAVVVPLLLAVLASAVRKYPFAGRLMLFAVPMLVLFVAHGAMVAADRLRDLGAAVRWLVVAAVCVAPALECNRLRKAPLHDEGSREVLARLRHEWQAGDELYLSRGAVPAVRYYWPAAPLRGMTYGKEYSDRPSREFVDDIQALPDTDRVWVLIAHFRPEEEAATRAALDSRGAGEVVLRRPDAVLMRYDLSGPQPLHPDGFPIK